MSLLNQWKSINNLGLLDLPGEFSISYRIRQLYGSCPDVHTYQSDFGGVVDIRYGTIEFTILAGPDWLCVEGHPVVLSSKDGTPFERMFDSEHEKLFGAILANYMSLSDPGLDADFANEKCGVFFDAGVPTRCNVVDGTRH